MSAEQSSLHWHTGEVGCSSTTEKSSNLVVDGSLGGVILTMGNEIVIRLHSKGSSLATIDRLLRIAVMFQLKWFSLSCRLFSECNWIKLITKYQEQETEPIKQPVASLLVLLKTKFSWLPCLIININERFLHLYKKELFFKGVKCNTY